MPAGCNCGPNSLLAQALGCHCVRRSILQSLPVSCHFRGCEVPLFRIVSGAISSELAFYLYTFIRNRNEPYLPLPSQPQLVLIYRPRRDGRLSRPWCEVAQAEIRTRNLPIANLALYHTATSAPVIVHDVSVVNVSSFFHILWQQYSDIEMPAAMNTHFIVEFFILFLFNIWLRYVIIGCTHKLNDLVMWQDGVCDIKRWHFFCN